MTRCKPEEILVQKALHMKPKFQFFYAYPSFSDMKKKPDKLPAMSPSSKHNPFCKLWVKTTIPRKKNINKRLHFHKIPLPGYSTARKTKSRITLRGQLEKVDRNKQCNTTKLTALCRSLTLKQVIQEVYPGTFP